MLINLIVLYSFLSADFFCNGDYDWMFTFVFDTSLLIGARDDHVANKDGQWESLLELLVLFYVKKLNFMNDKSQAALRKHFISYGSQNCFRLLRFSWNWLKQAFINMLNTFLHLQNFTTDFFFFLQEFIVFFSNWWYVFLSCCF